MARRNEMPPGMAALAAHAALHGFEVMNWTDYGVAAVINRVKQSGKRVYMVAPGMSTIEFIWWEAIESMWFQDPVSGETTRKVSGLGECLKLLDQLMDQERYE